MQHARPNRLRRAVAFAALAALLGLAALTLSHCTLVGDSLTGVNIDGVGPTSCVKQCNDFYAISYKREQRVHDTNTSNCQLLDQPQRRGRLGFVPTQVCRCSRRVDPFPMVASGGHSHRLHRWRAFRHG